MSALPPAVPASDGALAFRTRRHCGPGAPLLLRAIVGLGFVMHGQAKLVRGPEGFAVVLHTLGVPLPQLLAWLTTFVELIGGVAVLAGAFLPLVSIPLAIVLLMALFTIDLPYGFHPVGHANTVFAKRLT